MIRIASHSRLPSLWFYGANDSYFNQELVNRLYHAYAGAGGHARLVAYGAFKNDAHGMVGSRDGSPLTGSLPGFPR